MIEVAREVGPDLGAVIRQPYALTLWAYLQLQDRRRFEGWLERMGDIKRAALANWAFNAPERIEREREALLIEAAGANEAERMVAVRNRGERLARFIRKGKVLTS